MEMKSLRMTLTDDGSDDDADGLRNDGKSENSFGSMKVNPRMNMLLA